MKQRFLFRLFVLACVFLSLGVAAVPGTAGPPVGVCPPPFSPASTEGLPPEVIAIIEGIDKNQNGVVCDKESPAHGGAFIVVDDTARVPT